jgi:raffinose/stachyose/melibiose transport system substrate-binding protein
MHPRSIGSWQGKLPVVTFFVVLGLVLAACAAPQPAPAPAATAAPAEPTQVPEAPPPTAAPAPTEAPAAAEPVKLVIWWWGEQEAPGAQAWLEETMAKYKEAKPNVSFEAVLQSTDTLIPAFQSAAAAKQGPDIEYFWGGVWTLENAWNGSLIPIDDLFPAEEKGHWINNFERSYDGKLWGVPWYLSGNPFVYNPELFANAGVDPNAVKTWDDLIAACGKLKAAGVVPISGGLKDGWFGGWLFSILGRQGADSEKDFMQAVLTEGAFLDPKFSEWWSKLAELKDAGCWNEDINSVDYQQGQDLFVQGKSAMIFGNDTFLAGWAKDLGWDKMGVMMVPKYGTGKLADTYVTTAQGWGITSWSEHPQDAADFLQFMHTPERVNAWFEATGVLPADNRLDTGLIQQDQLKQIYEWDTQAAGPNLENFIPSIMDEQANFACTQLLFAGEKTPAQCAELTEEVLAKWREQSPDQVQNFENWAK